VQHARRLAERAIALVGLLHEAAQAGDLVVVREGVEAALFVVYDLEREVPRSAHKVRRWLERVRQFLGFVVRSAGSPADVERDLDEARCWLRSVRDALWSVRGAAA